MVFWFYRVKSNCKELVERPSQGSRLSLYMDHVNMTYVDVRDMERLVPRVQSHSIKDAGLKHHYSF